MKTSRWVNIALASYWLLSSCSIEGEKREWGLLQQLEAENRWRPMSRFEVLKRGDYQFICVPALYTGERTWILLNPKYAPFYKQIPARNSYLLSKKEIEKIKEDTAASKTVLNCIDSHTSDEVPQPKGRPEL